MSKAKSDSIKNSQSVPNIKNISPVSFWKLVSIPSVNLNLTEIDISFFLLGTETVFCSSCYCLLLIALLQSSNSWKELHIHIVFCRYNIFLGDVPTSRWSVKREVKKLLPWFHCYWQVVFLVYFSNVRLQYSVCKLILKYQHWIN